MRLTELRCTAPHPDFPGIECRAKLAEASDGSVVLREGRDAPPGCVVLRCRRCGAEYVVCPTNMMRSA